MELMFPAKPYPAAGRVFPEGTLSPSTIKILTAGAGFLKWTKSQYKHAGLVFCSIFLITRAAPHNGQNLYGSVSAFPFQS
jgi:hypothetical protein